VSTPSPSSPPPVETVEARLDALCWELVQLPSVITEEAALCDELELRARLLERVEVERIGNSIVCRGPRRDRPLISLFGHIDTVPPNAGSGPARREGDRLYGLGASDMKGGIAVMWALMERLDLDALPFDLAWVYYDQEEGPYTNNGLGPVLDRVLWLRETALAFCLEPSDNAVQVGAVGTLHAELTFLGKAAHSARPWQGENAIHKAGGVLLELAGRPPVAVDCGGFCFREVMSVTMAQGGRARNVIPDRFVLNLNYRFAPGKSVEDAQRDVLALVGGRAEVDFTDLCPSGRVVTNNPLLQRFVALTGAAVTAKQAWTDVARLGAVGIDAVNFGPGLTSQAHQRDEFVELPLLHQGYGMFHRFLTGG
jgi:succinyl-diaminopimelate desuccinylase